MPGLWNPSEAFRLLDHQGLVRAPDSKPREEPYRTIDSIAKEDLVTGTNPRHTRNCPTSGVVERSPDEAALEGETKGVLSRSAGRRRAIQPPFHDEPSSSFAGAVTGADSLDCGACAEVSAVAVADRNLCAYANDSVKSRRS